MKFNKNNCQFCKESIVFVGHIISSEGIWVDSSKAYAITKLSVLQSVTELQTFLGTVNYPGKFIPNLAEIIAPHQTLLTKIVVFNLQKPQLNAIENLKTLIASGLFLKLIGPNLPLRLKIDVKNQGLEALFEQNQGLVESPKWHPIGYSSRTLRDYEKAFTQFERVVDSSSSWSGTFPRIFMWSQIYHY